MTDEEIARVKSEKLNTASESLSQSADRLLEAPRDDLTSPKTPSHSIPLSKDAKAYARRSGMNALKKQPSQFQKVNAQITNPGKKDEFKNTDVGEYTDGTKA